MTIRPRPRSGRVSCAALLLGAALAAPAAAQVVHNPEDPFGFAIPYPRLRLVHSTDPAAEGATAHLRAHDPFLFYQLGRNLVNRQFEPGQAIMGRSAELDVPLYVGLSEARRRELFGDGMPHRFARDHAASCGLCHSSVYRDPSAGPTIASTGADGRNSTHFYGAGLVEMIGLQVRALAMARHDANGNGFIDAAEVAEPTPLLIRPTPEAEPIDYGDLSPDEHGVPRLNPVFRIWYVDEDGRLVPDALGLDHPGVAGFGFAMQPFGWGRGELMVGDRRVPQGGEAATLREFHAVAADLHMGLETWDPVQLGPRPETFGLGGEAAVSLNGARQFDFGGSVDRGRRLTSTGLSLDDPDGDGEPSELTAGDLDAVEFFLLHAPPPARRYVPEGERGRGVLHRIGCARCHVEEWELLPRDDEKGLAGDRRFFRLELFTGEHDDATEIQGRLVDLSRTLPSGAREPRRDGFLVEGVYSDFKHWDIGPAFHERRWDGSLQRRHRTAPLWGVANSAHYGHSGRFLDLDAVISAHGGAAAEAARAYGALPADERADLLAFLRSLVLYSTDELPADIDGDGAIHLDFEVGGQKVGYERFDARFLFRTPPRLDTLGWVTLPNGRAVPVGLATNVAAAYGLELEHRRDGDGDGFPDVVDPLPETAGILPEESDAQAIR